MSRTIALALFLVVAAGCRSTRPTSGTFTCSCSTAGCGCQHCSGEGAQCTCRPNDAFPDRMSVGEPGD